MRPSTYTAVVLAAVLLLILLGCGAPDTRGNENVDAAKTAKGRRVFLTVDFQVGRTLRYRFTSKRNITVDWDPNAATSANRVQEQSESFEMVVAYTPIEVDPYGASTIRAAVESVQAVRSGGVGARNFGTDAVQTAQGKTFTFKVDPRGRIVEASELTALIQEMGKRAFRADTSRGRIKEPDMIWDFIAGQWFLWDAASSVERPAEGVAVGQTWRSQLCVPTPMVVRLARNVVYELHEVRQDAAQPSWRAGRAAALRAEAALASRGHPGLALGDEGVPPSKRGQDARDTQGQDALATRRQGQDALATGGQIAGPWAVIRSTYTLADSVPAGWPIPYAGTLQMSGTFGFLASYEALGLEGAGEEWFNLHAGRIEQRREAYTLRVKAGLPPMGIKADPYITIDQTLTMELADSE